MTTVLRLVLGLVFLVSGSTKLADRAWPAQAAAFGAPAPVARVLPVVELVLGALVAAGVLLPWSALALLVLLLGFTAVVAVRLRDPERPPCACFGAWSAKPVSGRTVARNVVLAVLAAVVAVASR